MRILKGTKRDPAAELRRQRTLGVIVVALGALLLFVAFTGTVPLLSGGGGRTLTARFADAANVDASTPVRVGGVDVGTVKYLRPAPDHATAVVMTLTDSGVRLHSDASAQIRWRTLLGGSMYIDLHPGSPSAPPLRGEIPLSRTGAQVDWDQLNDQLPAATRPQFRRMLAGFDAGLASPAGEGRTLRALGPDARVVGQATDALRGQEVGDLSELVRGSAATMRALAAGRGSLRALIDSADVDLSVTAGHNVSLAQAIELSPPALDSTLTTSRRLDTMLSALDPLVSRLEPGARQLGPLATVLAPMLRRTDRLLVDSGPLLRLAPTALRMLGTMGARGVPLIAGLRPIVTRLNGNLLPLLRARSSDTRLRLYETIGPLASALSDSLSGFDANGGLYNFDVQPALGSLLMPCDEGPSASRLAQCLVPLKPSRRPGKGHR